MLYARLSRTKIYFCGEERPFIYVCVLFEIDAYMHFLVNKKMWCIKKPKKLTTLHSPLVLTSSYRTCIQYKFEVWNSKDSLLLFMLIQDKIYFWYWNSLLLFMLIQDKIYFWYWNSLLLFMLIQDKIYFWYWKKKD